MNTATNIQSNANSVMATVFSSVDLLHGSVTDGIEKAIFNKIKNKDIPEIDFAMEFKREVGVYIVKVIISESAVNLFSEDMVIKVYQMNLEAKSSSLHNSNACKLIGNLQAIGEDVCKNTLDREFRFDVEFSNPFINKSIDSIIKHSC